MNLSWSQKLFFLVNKQIGKKPGLDRAMFFCAHYLIYLLVVFTLFYAWVYFKIAQLDFFTHYFKAAAFLLTASLTTSWYIGWLWPHRRPIVEFPRIKILLRTWKTWKSFPSDHAIISFGLVEMVWFFSFIIYDNFYFNILFHIFLFLMATTVAISRVYVGVHYPRDIVGGIVLVSFYFWFFYINQSGWYLLEFSNLWKTALSLGLFTFLVKLYYYRRKESKKLRN